MPKVALRVQEPTLNGRPLGERHWTTIPRELCARQQTTSPSGLWEQDEVKVLAEAAPEVVSFLILAARNVGL